MSDWRKGAIVLLLIAAAGVGAADEPEGALTREERQARLAFMRKTVADFTYELDRDPPLPLTLPAEPALHSTNPVRNKHEGVTFFLLRRDRPMAAAAVAIRPQGKVVHEFTLLGDEPIVARRNGEAEWTPRKNGLPFAPIEGADAPARSAVLRLAQMRRLSQQFRVRVVREIPLETRLLTQPLLRYANPEARCTDGAVFAFVEATDPEVFLLLEARADDAHPGGRWHFSLARMTSQPIEVRRDDRLIWEVPGFYRKRASPMDSYVEAFDGIYPAEEGK